MTEMDIVPQLFANSIVAGATYALIALGFNLIYGTTKFFNLAHGAVAAYGAYAAYFLMNSSLVGAGPLTASVAVIAVAGLVGLASDSLIYAPLRGRKASPMVLMVASLGAFSVLQAVLAILFTSQFQSLSGGELLSGSYAGWGAIVTRTQAVIIASSVALLAGLALMMKKTMFGKAVAAIQDDEEVSRMVGIDTGHVIRIVSFIGSAIAGVAGILIGFDTGIEPTMGMSLLLKGTIASIVGGVGSLYGGFLGAFFLGFAENFGIWKVSGEWKDAIAFGVLIVFLLIRPQGIIKR